MRIHLKLEGILAAHAPENAHSYPIPEGATVGWLISHLGLSPEQVTLVFVDHQLAEANTRIPDNAFVNFCPFICGG
ncbi:MAG: thiamine S protein [Desulfovibrio sp.]|nr:thiamine S protein [Desulfovibrio sp.]MBI4957861.1 thiamine S protein [Desulfovibrio sp.]